MEAWWFVLSGCLLVFGCGYVLTRGRPKAEDLLSTENRNRKRKSIVSGPKPSASLMPACQGPQVTVRDADVDSAASFLGYLYIVSQYTVSLMTTCVWRIFCLRNSSSVPYFRQPPNLLTAARRHRKCAECGIRLLSAETECLPKVPICPHSAPKPIPSE